AAGKAGLLPSRYAEGDGPDLPAHGEPAQGHHAVSRGEVDALPAVARYARHGEARGRTPEVRRLWPLPDDLPGQLHPAHPRGGRSGQPVPGRLRNRRVPLHLLRNVPGGLPGRGDPRRAALRERRVFPGQLRIRPRSPDAAGAPVDAALGPIGSGERVIAILNYEFWILNCQANRRGYAPVRYVWPSIQGSKFKIHNFLSS